MPSVCFTVIKVETNKTVPNPKRDLRRFLGALATFPVCHTVTVAEWCRVRVGASLLLVVWRVAGNCVSCSHLLGAITLHVLTCPVLRQAASVLSCICVMAFFVTLRCLSISKLNKEGNRQNVPKLVLQLSNQLVEEEVGADTCSSGGREKQGMGVRSA